MKSTDVTNPFKALNNPFITDATLLPPTLQFIPLMLLEIAFPIALPIAVKSNVFTNVFNVRKAELAIRIKVSDSIPQLNFCTALFKPVAILAAIDSHSTDDTKLCKANTTVFSQLLIVVANAVHSSALPRALFIVVAIPVAKDLANRYIVSQDTVPSAATTPSLIAIPKLSQ